jgi:hypothetical protein
VAIEQIVQFRLGVVGAAVLFRAARDFGLSTEGLDRQTE